MALNRRVIDKALNMTFGEEAIGNFATNAKYFSGISIAERTVGTRHVDGVADSIQDVVARTNQILDQGAPVLSYDRQTNLMSTISNAGGKRTVKSQQFADEDARRNLHGFLMEHSSQYRATTEGLQSQRKKTLEMKRLALKRQKQNVRDEQVGFGPGTTESDFRSKREIGDAKTKRRQKQRVLEGKTADAYQEKNPALTVQEFDAPINEKYQKDLKFLMGKSDEAFSMGDSGLQARINEGIRKFEAGEITDPEDVMRMNYQKAIHHEPVYKKQSIMDRVMRRPKEELMSAETTYEKANVGERLGYEFKDSASKQKSNGSINPVSSEKAGAGDVIPGDMGYAGFSSGFERHATGAVIGAGMGMMSEGEVSAGGAVRGAMFGVAGAKAARMFTGSMRGGAINSMTRGVGDTLSAAGPGTMRETAGQFINKSMSGFDAAKSQQAMRMATFAGAGLAGFSMGRDRNHSRGMNGSRGSRF